MAASNSKKSSKGNVPRFDKYAKLLHLFYEPLILLHALGKTRGRRTSASVEEGSDEYHRKAFLDALSYVCDFEKGGQTTTAIAIEESEQYIFWFALNKSSIIVQAFLESTLSTLRESLRRTRAPGGEHGAAFVDRLTRDCFAHAKKRIDRELRWLGQCIEECTSRLGRESTDADMQLATWLNKFRQGDSFTVCSLAYDSRHGQEMIDLKAKSQENLISSRASDKKFKGPFAEAHHLIGRLADHIRAPKRLVETAKYLEQVFDSDFVVRQAPTVEPVLAPKVDKLTNLPSILRRMGLESTENEEALMDLDRKMGIEGRVLKEFNSTAFMPTVHAEIQLHELFNAAGRQKQFAFDFPVIGCSKAACFCCNLYIKSHPARHVEPDCHGNIWLNWSPPALPAGASDSRFHSQRKTLYKMLEDIRGDAKEQILSRCGGKPRQPDSTTGITKLSGHDLVRNHDLAHGLAALSIAEDPSEDLHGASDDDLDEFALQKASQTGSSGGSQSSSTRGSVELTGGSPSHSTSAGTHGSASDADSDEDDGGGVILFTPGKRNWPRS